MFDKAQTKSARDSDVLFVVNPKLKEFSQFNSHNNNNEVISIEQERERLKHSHAGILRVFLSFAFFLCISPFRIVKDAEGKNVAKRWFLQMVACMAVTVVGIYSRLTDVRKAFPVKNEQWNPVVYFRIFHTICSLGLTLNAWWSLWKKSNRFVEVVEYIDSTKALPYLESKISYVSLAVIACFLYACLGFTSALLGSELMDSHEWSPSSWSRCLVLEGRYQFFLGPESEKCNETLLENLEITAADPFLAAVTGCGQFFKYITSFYWELMILFGVLSLWLPSAAFANYLKDDTEDENEEEEQNPDEKILEAAAQWPMLEEQYLSLKDLSELINNAFGAMVFSYTFTSIFYYSINLDAFLLTTDILVRIRLIVLYLGAVVLYILAADVCRQVGHLEIWLSEYADDEAKSNVPFHRLTVILNELSTSTIGISGWNVFTITYSVVANMTSVLITYFIICVQFRTAPTS